MNDHELHRLLKSMSKSYVSRLSGMLFYIRNCFCKKNKDMSVLDFSFKGQACDFLINLAVEYNPHPDK